MSVNYDRPARNQGYRVRVGARRDSVSEDKKPGNLPLFLTRTAATEFLVVAATAYLASALYHRAVFLQMPPTLEYAAAALLIALLVLLVSLGFKHFRGIETQPLHRFLWNGIGAVALAFSFFLSALFLAKIAEGYSRGTFLFQFLGVGVAVLAVRSIFYSRLQSAIASGLLESRRVVLIGNVARHPNVAERITRTGTKIIGSIPFLASERTRSTDFGLRRKIDAGVSGILATCRALQPDDVIILPARDNLPETAELAHSLSELPVAVHVVPVGAMDLLATSRATEFGDVLTVRVSAPPLSAFDLAVKRAFDVALAITGLLVFSPLFLIISAAIKLDSRGPVFFRQTRHGYNNQPIQVLKFRSMYIKEDERGFTQAVEDDPRVTRAGRILRRTNIDELPQLFNVLRGDMSIVGPRPHAIAHNKMFEGQISPFLRRHNVKPGLTGWAQVNGLRGETDTVEKMQRRVEYDLYYIDNWSFLFDVKIIMMTVFSKRAFTNAY